jgi:hypothetical protein
MTVGRLELRAQGTIGRWELAQPKRWQVLGMRWRLCCLAGVIPEIVGMNASRMASVSTIVR